MPFPNEHAFRLRDPDDFVRITQIWEKEKAGIRALGGPLKSDPDGAMEEASIRFKASKWTFAEAKKWIKDHGYKPILSEAATGEKKEDGRMEKIIKVGKLYRDFQIRKSHIDVERRTVSLSFSSETDQVVRWAPGVGDYIEVLDHSPGAADLTRLKRAGALLIDHDPRNQVGKIEEVTIGEDRKGRATVRFGRSSKAEEIFQDVVDEIKENVSFGYEPHEMKLMEEQADGPDVYRVTKWTPFEISLVSIPADISVGIGRGGGQEEREIKIEIPEQKPKEERTMSTIEKCKVCQTDLVDGKCGPCEAKALSRKKTEQEAVAAVTATAQRQSAEQLERDRIHGINTLCKMNKMPEDYREMWVGQGVTVNEVADEILRILEERGKTNPQPLSRIGMSQNEAQQFSLIRAIDACYTKDWSKAGYELEVSRAVAQKMNKHVEPTRFLVPYEVLQRPVSRGGPVGGSYRDLTAGTTSAGGYLVETQNVGFIELLYNRSVCLRMGARRLSGLTANVTIPRMSAGSTAYWLTNEATQATETNLTFAQVSLTPKNIGAYVEISRQLMLQSSPGAEGIVSDDLAKQVAVKVDLAGLEGSGTEQPTGIANTSGIGSFTGATLTYAYVLNAQEDLATSNITPIRGGYVGTPAVASICMQRQRFSSTDTPLWVGNIWDGAMCGFPAMSSNQLTAATMIFGDWQELILAEWGVLEIEVNPYANFQAGIVGVRAMYSMDVGVRRAAAFTRATSIT